jgi:hypothetical protein
MSKLLLGPTREKLSPYVAPADADDSVVNGRLNEVGERFINGGKWKGTMVDVAVSVFDGQITLPRSLETVLGVTFNGVPKRVRPSWFHILGNGTGRLAAGKANAGPVDVAGSFVTFRDPTAPFYLRAETDAAIEADNAALTIEGLDEDGEVVYTVDGEAATRGLSLEIDAPTYTDQPLSAIRAVIKPVTKLPVKLYAVDTTTSAETLIAIYEPGETLPAYRRYLVSERTENEPVLVFAKRAHVPAVVDNDELIPPNFGAFKLGILALNYEDTNDLSLARQYWAEAYQLLNSEAKEHFGPNAGGLQIQGAGFGAHGIAALR